MVVLVSCKNEEDPIKAKALEWPQHFFIITLWELYVAMETRVTIRAGPKPPAAFPPTPMTLQMKFGCDRLNGPLIGEILMFESVYRQTDRLTDRRRLEGYTKSSPCETSAQVN